MKILAISDLHGDFRLARKACGELRPDLLLCCGDWGDAGLVQEKAFAEFLALCPVLTVFGNHDSLELLASLNNQDGSPVLLAQGEVRVFNNLRVAGISGIWAKSHRLPHYVTDTDVREWSSQIARQGPIDVLLTHGCPVGLADLTPTGRHGGQRCFLDAFRTVAPQIHLCGHLHVAQERRAQGWPQGHQRGRHPGGIRGRPDDRPGHPRVLVAPGLGSRRSEVVLNGTARSPQGNIPACRVGWLWWSMATSQEGLRAGQSLSPWGMLPQPPTWRLASIVTLQAKPIRSEDHWQLGLASREKLASIARFQSNLEATARVSPPPPITLPPRRAGEPEALNR